MERGLVSMQGQTVRLFLVEGTSTGIITAEIMNWTGHLLVAPRSKLAEALVRDEATRTGVYILVGDDPDAPGKPRIYVGEGDNVRDRLKMHAKDPSKEFWTRVIVITSKDTNLTKAHVRYLENRLVQLAKLTGRASVANGNQPSAKLLPESDVADMEFFLKQLQLALPIVGVDALRSKPKPKDLTVLAGTDLSDDGSAVELSLKSKKHGIQACAIEKDGEVTILSGSTATANAEFSTNTYSELRNNLIAEGVLSPAENGECLIFKTDVTLPSPSAAAAVIFNRNSNGRTAWKLKSTGQTLKDWQDAQLEELSPQPREAKNSLPRNVPSADSELSEVLDFCQTLDGYADERSIDNCFDIARKVESEGLANASLHDLSIAAFIWQRAYAWGSPQEAPMYERKIRAAVEEIRRRSSQ